MVLKRFITVLAVTLPLSWCALSQEVPQGEKDFGRRLERVRELYGNDMYQAARAGIDDIFQQCSVPAAVEPELAAYRIVCDIRLGSPNVDALMDEYREKYRHAPEYMGVRLLYAGYYFDRKDYVRALEILETVEYPLLSRKDRTKFLFQRSFCQLRAGRLADARNGFDRLLEGRHTAYTTASVYYRGYIAYTDNDFEKAVKLLSTITGLIASTISWNRN